MKYLHRVPVTSPLPPDSEATSSFGSSFSFVESARSKCFASLMGIDCREGVEKRWYLRDLKKLSIEDLREHKNLIAALMEIYRSKQAHVIGKVAEHRRIAREQERQHLRGLTGLSIKDLRLALKGVSDLPDTRGRLANERM